MDFVNIVGKRVSNPDQYILLKNVLVSQFKRLNIEPTSLAY